jgi:transposase InsO family protein
VFTGEQSLERKPGSSCRNATKAYAAAILLQIPPLVKSLRRDIFGRVYSKTALNIVRVVLPAKLTEDALSPTQSYTPSSQQVHSKKWGLDFVGALPKTTKRNEYLIVATDYLTKWSEAAAVKKCTQDVAADFLYNQVICQYGCPLEVITDQGSHFTSGVVTKLLSKLSVKHRRVTPYYPQANGMVEKTNGILTGIIAKVILDKRNTWDNHVGEALWAYRTAYKLTTGYTPFQLVFGFEAVVPIELEVPSLRLAVQHGLGDVESLEARLLELERLDETRRRALWNVEVMQHRRKERHDAQGKLTSYPAGSLVMLVDSWLQKHGQKFRPKWKGPFVIHRQFDNDTYKLSTPDGRIITKTYNGAKLKAYKHLEHLQV